jgi:nucleoside 2-deoxyribosyltransferase
VKPIIYLANPYGFSTQQRELLVPLKQALEKYGEVWEPFERCKEVATTGPGWPYDIGQKCFNDVVAADAIFAVVNGAPPDEGVMVELGMAIALKKKIFLFRDDFRRCTDSEAYPLNLMIFAGLSQHFWQEHYYTSVEDIDNKTKALFDLYG